MREDIDKDRVKEILEEFSDIVAALKFDGYMQQDAAIARNIRLVILAGISRDHHEDILDVILKMKEEKRSGQEVAQAGRSLSNWEKIRRILDEDRRRTSTQYHYTSDNHLNDNEPKGDYDLAEGPYEEGKGARL